MHQAAVLLIGGGLPSAAGVEIVPVQDRVEAHGEGALCLPPPEGTDREHDHMPLTDRLVDELSAVTERRAALEGAGKKHVVRVGGKLHNDTRLRGRIGGEAGDASSRGSAPAPAAPAAPAPAATRAGRVRPPRPDPAPGLAGVVPGP